MIGRAGIMVCAATSTTVTAPRGAVAASSAVMSAATTSVVSATTSATAAVEAATTSTAVTTATMLRKRGRRGKHRHGEDRSEQNLEESGPVHVWYLHPTTTQEVRAARNAEAILHQLDSHGACLVADWLSLSPSANHTTGDNRTPALEG